MTDAEIKGRIVPLILEKWASDQTSSLRGNVAASTGSGPGIGAFSNTERSHSIGYHAASPYALAATTTWHLQQDTSTESSSPTWPVGWEGSGVIREMNTTKLKTDILRCCAIEWVKASTNTGTGSYYIGTAAPSLGGTWTQMTAAASGGGTYVDSWVDTYKNSGSITQYLWRKTNSTVADSSGLDYTPCKAATVSTVAGNIQQMTDVEVESLVNEWRNFLLTAQGTIGGTNIGTIGEYQLTTSSGAPSGGTWVQMGTFTDQLADVNSQDYTTYYGTFSPKDNGYPNYHTFAGDTVVASYLTTIYYLWRCVGGQS
jgi:hypothetical protein